MYKGIMPPRRRRGDPICPPNTGPEVKKMKKNATAVIPGNCKIKILKGHCDIRDATGRELLYADANGLYRGMLKLYALHKGCTLEITRQKSRTVYLG